MRGLLQRWTQSSIILISKEESVWRNKRPRSRTASSEEDRSVIWSTNTSGSLGANDSVENYADLFTISLRNDDVQEFDSKWDGILLSMTKIPLDDILEGLYKLRIRVSVKLKTVLELYDLEIHQKKLGLDYHRLKLCWKEVSSKKFEIKIWGAEMEILRRTPWSLIREQNSVYKELLEIVGNGKPAGSVWKKTIAVSATISISVEKLHHQIRLRILSCSRMSENHREPEVPEEKVPVVECLDGLARITWKELAITHFVKSGTLQNACSTRPRVVVGLGKVLICTSSGWWTAD